jgi:ankyrin repeat protein
LFTSFCFCNESTIFSAFLRSISEDPSQQVLDKLADGIASLFSNKDFIPVLRICRPFIRKRPELLHQAIDNNYSDLVSTFVSVAGIELLQHKNQFGETVLFHAARLNRVDIVEALLERKNSEELIEDTNNKNQNIFHILALNKNSDLILNLFIDYLLKKSINIQKKFDHVDIDNHTPLQLAIKNYNLSATRHFLKYFDKNLCSNIYSMKDN